MEIILVIGILILWFLGIGYVKAPPDTAIIISGIRKKPRVLIGKAGVKLPFFERSDILTLEPITINLKMNKYSLTEDSAEIKIDTVVKVHVNTDDSEAMQLAIRTLLNKKSADICEEIEGPIMDILRKTISSHRIEVICEDIDYFCKEFVKNLKVEISKYGLIVMTCYIQEIKCADEKL